MVIAAQILPRMQTIRHSNLRQIDFAILTLGHILGILDEIPPCYALPKTSRSGLLGDLGGRCLRFAFAFVKMKSDTEVLFQT